jgi:hypothetical protein
VETSKDVNFIRCAVWKILRIIVFIALGYSTSAYFSGIVPIYGILPVKPIEINNFLLIVLEKWGYVERGMGMGIGELRH